MTQSSHITNLPTSPTDEKALFYEKNLRNYGSELPESQGSAIFSTNNGQRPKRPNYKSQPMQMRSDRKQAILDMSADLRENFAYECINITPENLQRNESIFDYFDNFDVHFYSPYFLHLVLENIVESNMIESNARAAEVTEFSFAWIKGHPEAFRLFEPGHTWRDLVAGEENEQYGFPFLWDAFWKIKQTRDEMSEVHPSPAIRSFLIIRCPVHNSARDHPSKLLCAHIVKRY